jgi:RNA polymerase sigma-70 factor (ECF subfamily)
VEQPNDDGKVLERARAGDESAFRGLVEPFRRALFAHCYRMLGSAADAEDALQEALVRAWKGLPGFEGRSSLRSWLYRIATNTSLDVVERRPRRMLPQDRGPATDSLRSSTRSGLSPVRTTGWTSTSRRSAVPTRATPRGNR